MAFAQVNKEIVWEGEGLEEVGKDVFSDDVLVRIDPRYFRPAEVDLLIGDPSKAKKLLGWEAKISLEELVREMVAVSLHNAKRSSDPIMLAEL